MGKVRRTVIAHVPIGVVSHLRIFPRTGRTRLNNPSLLEVETGLVCPSESHSISLSSTLLTQRRGLSPYPNYKKGNVQPSVAGQSYHITGDFWNSTKAGSPLYCIYTYLVYATYMEATIRSCIYFRVRGERWFTAWGLVHYKLFSRTANVFSLRWLVLCRPVRPG